VPILPPHRYRDLVVQPATGCPNHRCRFCAFYRGRPFRVLDDEAFAEHLEAIGTLFGAALAGRDGVFLGSASALTLPDDLLLARMRAVADAFGRPRRGFAAFLDPDRGPERDASGWARLAGAGLVEAALGLESGHAPLRAAMGKSDDLARVARTVAALGEGGVAATVMVLVGLGGAEHGDRHREATADFVGGLELGPRDRVYLSPLIDGAPDLVGAAARAAWRDDLAGRTAARIGDYRAEHFAWLA
jgi:radical SAM superfamily enzyme YgiQ (UPF0313 family)